MGNSQSQSKLDISEWAEALQKNLQAREKRPQGEGWASYEQLSTVMGVGKNTLYKFLRDNCERFVGAVEKDGQLVKRVWYRLKK